MEEKLTYIITEEKGFNGSYPQIVFVTDSKRKALKCLRENYPVNDDDIARIEEWGDINWVGEHLSQIRLITMPKNKFTKVKL